MFARSGGEKRLSSVMNVIFAIIINKRLLYALFLPTVFLFHYHYNLRQKLLTA